MTIVKPDNPAVGIFGFPVDPVTGERIEVTDEREHFYQCKACGQAVDMRDLGQVFHHVEPGHLPLTLDA